MTDARREALDALARFERTLASNAIPEGELHARLAALCWIVTHGRHVRVGVVGRRGAGKSSLINAVAGASVAPVGAVGDATGRSARYVLRDASAGRAVEWVDTPGLRAGGRADRRDDVRDALVRAPCDAVVMPCTATEVDAGIDEDLDDLRALLDAQHGAWGYRPEVIAAVTRVDDLAPADVTDPPFDDAEKRANIRLAVTVLHRHMLRAGVTPRGVVPVVTSVEWDGDGVADDCRWNVPALTARVHATLPPEGERLDARREREFQGLLRSCCDALIDAFATRASVLATAGAPREQRRELGGLQRDAVAALELLLGLAAREPVVANVADTLGAALDPGGLVEALRAGIVALGARRVSASVAAARVRALGAAVMAMEWGRSDASRVRALVTPGEVEATGG